ncbi:MAG: hypothetical protein AAGD12_14150 [Pseudomonadota bacterium]
MAARSAAKAILALVVLGGGVAEAASIVVSPTDRGWYGRSTGHDPSNENFLVGKCCGQIHRNFFSFDLTGIEGTVTRAFLKFETGPNVVFDGTDATTAFRLRKYEGDAAALLDGSAGFDGYKGLRDRDSAFYGSKNVETPGTTGVMPDVRVSLNRGLADLNSMLGQTLILGGHTRGPGFLWGFSSATDSVKLVLEVDTSTSEVVVTPLPPSAALLASAALVFGALGWRRRRQNLAA